MEEIIFESTAIEAKRKEQETAGKERADTGKELSGKRSLQDLNLLDDFLFNAVLSYPRVGEEFSRKLLGIIFQRKFGRLTVVPQKVYYGSSLGKHGVRLDVYLEAGDAGTEPGEPAVLYDLEPECRDRRKDMEALPRRVRFYHSKLDAGSLKSGTDYRELKTVVVVMIMPNDPFGKSRMVYTIRNICEEEPDMPYDDGARTLFLYTKGTRGNAPEDLKRLLKYMEETTRENAVTGELKEIQEMVEQVKRDGEVLLGYMKIFEREARLVEIAREEEKKNTNRERQRAEAAESQVKAERSRADEAEEQVRLLKEELEKLRKNQK